MGRTAAVILAGHIPWDQVEEAYGENFCDDNGSPAKSARIALGALLIKERLGASDRETVDQIRENPFLQYFLGFKEYQDQPPFDASLMTHFRKRFDPVMLNQVNESIVARAKADEAPKPTTKPAKDDKDTDRDTDNDTGADTDQAAA